MPSQVPSKASRIVESLEVRITSAAILSLERGHIYYCKSDTSTKMDSLAFTRLRERQVSVFAEQLQLETSITRLEPPQHAFSNAVFAEHVPAAWHHMEDHISRISSGINSLANEIMAVAAAVPSSGASSAATAVVLPEPTAEELLRDERTRAMRTATLVKSNSSAGTGVLQTPQHLAAPAAAVSGARGQSAQPAATRGPATAATSSGTR